MLSVYVDFCNADPEGRVRLNTIGSIRDLAVSGAALRNGLRIRLYSEDFEVVGTVEFSDSEHIWTARFNESDMIAKEGAL